MPTKINNLLREHRDVFLIGLAAIVVLQLILTSVVFVLLSPKGGKAASSVWAQTTQADFESGERVNVDTSTSAGDVKLAKVSPNKALSLDGVDDYAEIPDSSALKPDYITVETWVKSAGSGHHQFIIGKSASTTTPGDWGLTIASDTQKFRWHVSNGSWPNYIESTTTPQPNVWYHVVGIYNGTTSRLYINGTEESSRPLSGTLTKQARPITLGASEDHHNDYWFNGLIDDVRVWNKALSQQEIQANMNKEISAQAGLVGYWKLNGDANDSSGNNNNGTLVGGPTYVDGAPLTAPQASFGQALNFGATQYVDLGNSDKFNITENITMSAWIKPKGYPQYHTGQILTKQDRYQGAGYTMFEHGPGAYFAFHVYAGTTASPPQTQLSTLENEKWYHVTATYDGSTMKAYVNGVLASSIENSGPIKISSINLAIGNTAQEPNQQFTGSIDDVQLWNKALTQQEIASNMNQEISPQAGLVGYWKLNGDANDSSGNNNNGTLVGGPTYVDGAMSAGSLPYQPTGSLISSTKDTNDQSVFEAINWSADVPSQSGLDAVKFQIATNKDNSTWNFVGPDGTANTYYDASGTSIWPGHNSDRYIKYKMYLFTTDTAYTPTVHDVSISFSPSNTPPKATITSPTADQEVAGLLNVNYSISDPDTAPYNLPDNSATIEISPDQTNWKPIASMQNVGIQVAKGLIPQAEAGLPNSGTYSLDTSLFKNGTYYLKISAKDNVCTQGLTMVRFKINNNVVSAEATTTQVASAGQSVALTTTVAATADTLATYTTVNGMNYKLSPTAEGQAGTMIAPDKAQTYPVTVTQVDKNGKATTKRQFNLQVK